MAAPIAGWLHGSTHWPPDRVPWTRHDHGSRGQKDTRGQMVAMAAIGVAVVTAVLVLIFAMTAAPPRTVTPAPAPAPSAVQPQLQSWDLDSFLSGLTGPAATGNGIYYPPGSTLATMPGFEA